MKKPPIPPKKKLKIGDTIKVIGYRPGKYAPGIRDEIGTEKLFQSLVGRSFKIKGFDDYGNIELWPERLHTVWIESDLVELTHATATGNRAIASERELKGHS